MINLTIDEMTDLDVQLCADHIGLPFGLTNDEIRECVLIALDGGSDAAYEGAVKILMRRTPTMTVTIPSTLEHNGFYSSTVKILETCPICGERRGDTYKGISYDGSRRLLVDQWDNPCGHIDKYTDVLIESKKNGLNKPLE